MKTKLVKIKDNIWINIDDIVEICRIVKRVEPKIPNGYEVMQVAKLSPIDSGVALIEISTGRRLTEVETHNIMCEASQEENFVIKMRQVEEIKVDKRYDSEIHNYIYKSYTLTKEETDNFNNQLKEITK